MEILSFVGIEHLAHRKSSELPFGWQRLLEIARALASNPKVLLLDEPAAGLNATETRQLGKLLKKIQKKGITLLLVEHDMSLTMEIFLTFSGIYTIHCSKGFRHRFTGNFILKMHIIPWPYSC